MKAKTCGKVFLTTVLVASVGAFYGCNGGDTDGGAAGDETFDGSVFVADDLGSIIVDVLENPLAVGETSGFFVEVKNADGVPVKTTRISCDSEEGVTILEPSTGSEFTDENGKISGVIGCSSKGSYLFGCRLPVGGNKRSFVTVRCSGDAPSGFDGFAGAGGGLGGGSGGSTSSSDGNEPSDGNVQITKVSFKDGGQDNTVDIDTSINACDGDGDEAFTDAIVTLSVVNDSAQEITITSYQFSVPNVSGSTFTSSELAFNNSTNVLAAGSSADLISLFAQAVSASGNDKFFPGATTAIPDLGIRNVTFTIFGVDGNGNSFSATTTAAVSFGAYDRC